MKTVLERKARQRHEKGQLIPFNYFVAEYKPPEDSSDYSLESHPELNQLINFLVANHAKLPIGLRFQIAILIDGHWTCIDNIITEKGISAFNLDSVMDRRARHFFQVYLTNLQLNNILDSGYIYNINVPSDGPFAETPKEKVANMIQQDWVSCGIFVVDHLSFLSRTNVFKHLKKAFGEGQYQEFARADIPPALSPIFRLAQGEELFEKLSKRQKQTIATKKDKTKLGELDGVAYSAKNKGKRLLEDAHAYIEKPTAYQEIFGHNLLQQLEGYVKHYSKPVNDLIAYIHNALPQCEGLIDEEAIKFMQQLHNIILKDDIDIKKIIEILEISIENLGKLNDVSAYRILAGVISYAALNIIDNQELFEFYKTLEKRSIFDRLSNHTNSFFSKPTPFTPSLISHIENGIKSQLLYNATADLSKSSTRQLDYLNDNSVTQFINKPRTFDTSETTSKKLLAQLNTLRDSQDKKQLDTLSRKLEAKRATVFDEFNFKIKPTHSSSSATFT
ncbi:Uncharacterised protein [Legionella busanensis]|nr:hypothetical protein [Legionella busanensis]STX81659.1 Uncharacterised protein [Legionella busanensis]